MACWACGLDSSRVRQLEAENEALRAQLQLLSGCSPETSLLSIKNDGNPRMLSRTASAMMSFAAGSSASSENLSDRCSPTQHHVVRGYTAADLAEVEVEAVEELQYGELEVKVDNTPRHEATCGACTVVHVRTIDRTGLLAQLSAVLAGVDLSIARALFTVSEQGVASNEFWVQQSSFDGRLGPILEGVKRRAIEQRVRQWSAGQRLELRAQHLPFTHASFGLSELLKLPRWQGVVELPQHKDEEELIGAGAEQREALINALTAALTTDCTWLGALPPVLARQTASDLLPRMCRVRLPVGANILRNRQEQLGTDYLLLLEEEMPVMCGLGSTEGDASTAPVELEACATKMHPAGSVLCLSSTVKSEGRQLAWHSLSAPSSGVVRVIDRSALRELFGDTRKAAVRRHAKQLASAAYFAPLGTPQLLALCHRTVEMDTAPMSRIDILGTSPAQLARQGSTNGNTTIASRASLLASGSSPVFVIVLRGAAVVTYTPPAGSTASGAAVLQDGRVPIHRLRQNDHYGAIQVLRNRVDLDLQLWAGEEGCTLLVWTSDEFLQRELKKLPELLSSSWAARSPLSLATSMPRIVTLLEPISLDEMRARAAEQRGSDRAAQGVIAPKAALCLLLSGKLYEDAAVKVTIEALEDGKPSLSDEMDSADSASPLSKVTLSEHNVAVTSEVGMGEATHQSCQQASGFDDGEVAVGSRRLVVSVEIPARGPRLKQITGLLAELQLDVTSGSVAMNGKLATDTFHVRYRGALSLRVLAATLRAKLRTALQLSALVPGDTIEASRTRPFTIHANASGGAAPSSMGDLTDSAPAAAAAAEATDEDATIAAAPLLGLLDLRALARELARPALVLDGGAAPEHPESELWLRYLQVHAPGLLASLAPTPATPQATTAPTTEEWLSALRGFMMLSLRRSIGGPQLLDGVQMGDLQLGTILGEGAYGQVYLARHKVLPDRWYAVKRQQLDAAMQTSHVGKQQLRYLEREREVLMLLARESRGKQEINLFVQLVTHSQDAASLQLAMTAVLGGELFQILEETGPMKESEVQFYAANVVQALEHLHSRGIAYRDLKSENVLLSGGFTHAAAGWPVLADFGLANWLKNDGASLQTFCGTPAFIAPEVAAQNGHGAAADWWSLGILIFQCLTLYTPFEGPTAHATIENIIHGRRVQEGKARARIGKLSKNAAGIVDALLHPDPAERLGGPLRGNEVRVHPFFWGFDFSQIEKRQMTPPHAARCRERAVAATQHPSLRLPPLPNLVELASAAEAANGRGAP